MPVTLSKETTAKAIASIQRYFREQLDQDIGELGARLLLDFVLEEIGPCVYNAAIADAQSYRHDRVTDLEGACFAPEFQYWAQKGGRRTSR